VPGVHEGHLPRLVSRRQAPGDPEHLDSILATLGKDPEAVVSLANSQEIRDRYDSETSVARSMGIFGSPTFAVGDEIFWGDDRLEDALEWCK
jgi:2-hydroxychromene-2-carboxylate isomerase